MRNPAIQEILDTQILPHSNREPVAGQLYEYIYDDIGNRTATQSGGDSSGVNLNAASYTAAVDGRNLYSSSTVPGKVQELGLAKDYASSRKKQTATSPRMNVGITPGTLRIPSSRWRQSPVWLAPRFV